MSKSRVVQARESSIVNSPVRRATKNPPGTSSLCAAANVSGSWCFSQRMVGSEYAPGATGFPVISNTRLGSSTRRIDSTSGSAR